MIRFSPLNLTFDFVAGASVLIIIKLAAEAWRKRHSPLFQFNLKELLAVVLTVGCALGWLHARRTEYYKQVHVIQTLAANEAWSVHEEWERGGPTWLREIIGDRYFKWFDRVVEMRLESDSAGIDLVVKLDSLRMLGLPSRISRSDIAKLHQLRHLTALDFYGAYFDIPDEEMDGLTSDEACHLTDTAFAELATLSSLQGMNLYGSEITGTGLAALSSLDKMHVLDLTDTEVDDEGMPTLAKMTKLRTLSLRSTKITDDGIANLANLGNLEELSLGSTEITDVAIQRLLRLQNLRQLDLEWTAVSDASLHALKEFKKLEYLNVFHTKLTKAAVDQLRLCLPKCYIGYAPY